MQPSVRSALALGLLALGLLTAPGTVLAEALSYNMNLLKNLNPYGGANDVWGYHAPDGTELAIYGHREGTSFVDATDPANAVEVFNLPGPASTWRDIKTYLNYAYIVTEGQGGGLAIVDLTDPLAPVHVTTYFGSGFDTAHNIWIDTGAGVAYACGANGGGMHIVSLADPENPVQLSWFGSYYIHDLYVGDGVGYAGAISSGSLRIVDVSDPSNPSTLASHFYSGAVTHNAWPTSDLSHCATSDETGGGHMKVWDISNLSNISLASEWTVGSGIIHNILIKNDLAYISYYTEGTRLVDLTEPTNPVEIGFYDTSTSPSGYRGNWGVYPFRDDNVIYSSDMQNGLYILEFTGSLAGDIVGVVRDGQSSAPLDGAEVAVAGVIELSTDTAGGYAGSIAGGTYEVVTTRFGYEPDTASVAIPADGVVQHDVDLTAVANGAVQLTIVEAGSSVPVVGASAEVLGAPIGAVLSDGAGQLTISSLPAGIPWTVRLGRFGRVVTDVVVVTSASSTVEVDVSMASGFFDDFETDQGWIVGAVDDDATDGFWEREIPVGSNWIGPVGPGEDASATGEGYAYVTESHTSGTFVGTSDVDNGKTTLLTPVFDGTGIGDLTLTYTRWLSNRAPSPDDDQFRVDVSTDGGSSWTNLETVDVGTDAWAAVAIDLSGVVTPTSQMQLRFVAEDLSPDTFVEAGLDDLDILPTATDVQVSGPFAGSLSLSAPSPNPFSVSTTLAFEIPTPGRVSLELFDVNGRRIRTLLEGERVAAGSHRARWDGRDASGRSVAPGVYFAKLVAPDGERSRKITFLR